MYEFVSLGNIKGYQDEVAPRIEERKKEAVSFGVNVRDILYASTRTPVDYDEKEDCFPQLLIFFEAPDDEAAMRFAKSLYPFVKGQNLLNVSREPAHLITFRSEEEYRASLQRKTDK